MKKRVTVTITFLLDARHNTRLFTNWLVEFLRDKGYLAIETVNTKEEDLPD